MSTPTHMVFVVVSFGCLLSVPINCMCGVSAASDFAYFNTADTNDDQQDAPVIHPWKTVPLDPEYGGQWMIAGDLDGDGAVEIVSAQNVNGNDVHYTSAAVAQKLDGSVLWRWGNPQIGRRTWHHDVACQIHDWNGDGTNDVILCSKKSLVELDGATGRQLRALAIPENATDCLVFCNLSGGYQASDVLVKNRYHEIWAYNRDGQLLWSVSDPGGYRTAHQPRPMDLDNDGRDEIMAGYALLNSDGSVRWTCKPKAVDPSRGHLDCARIVQMGSSLHDVRIILTCCGANDLVMCDGNGKMLWEVAGRHFESVDVGHVIPGHPGRHVVVDIDHQPYGASPLWVLDSQGRRLGQLVTNYSRHHCLLDWNGDGVDEIVVANSGGLYDHHGRRIATLAAPEMEPSGGKPDYERSLLKGDMTGDGLADLVLVTPDEAYVYANPGVCPSDKRVPLGTGMNFTLY